MVKFKQLIKPGNKGGDVTAVKRAMLAMHTDGAGSMGKNDFAGNAFVHCVRKVQRNHGLKVDGIYGKSTHKWVAPHFDRYGRMLYRTCKLRSHPVPPFPGGNARQNAEQLLLEHKRGRYRADNSGELYQIERMAKGEPVWSPEGRWLYIDDRVFQSLLWLIRDKDFTIGTFAMCSDHPYDGPLGHAGGHAVDISSINGVSIAEHNQRARALTLEVASFMNERAPRVIHPWQEICDGYGYIHDAAISDECIPDAAFYGYPTLAEHRNHIHLGFR